MSAGEFRDMLGNREARAAYLRDLEESAALELAEQAERAAAGGRVGAGEDGWPYTPAAPARSPRQRPPDGAVSDAQIRAIVRDVIGQEAMPAVCDAIAEIEKRHRQELV